MQESVWILKYLEILPIGGNIIPDVTNSTILKPTDFKFAEINANTVRANVVGNVTGTVTGRSR